MVFVSVTDKNRLEFAIRLFKKKTQKENIVRDARLKEAFEKPCEKRKRKWLESKARLKKKKKPA